MKIGIVGWFGYDNAGDEAMKDICLKEFPGSVAMYRGQIEECDAYIVAGGGLVQEWSGFYPPDLYQQNKPFYALSLGARPGWEEKRDLIKDCLKNFRKIFVRNQQSYDSLSKVHEIDGLMPDLVLLCDTDEKIDCGHILSYTTRSWLNEGKQFHHIKGSRTLLVINPEDARYGEPVDYLTFLKYAKGSKSIIGTRLHSIVLGAIAGVPLAGIAYDSKVEQFCLQYNIPCYKYGLDTEITSRRPQINLVDERRKIREAISVIKQDLKTL